MYSSAIPPTTGGSTRGSSTRARRTDWPGNRPRASTSAIGTPSTTHTAVLAVAVFKLKTSAAREDSEVISGMKCAQSILSRIATSGTITKSAPTDGRQVDPGGQPDLDQPAGPPRSGHGAAKPAAAKTSCPCGPGDEIDELLRGCGFVDSFRTAIG